MTRRPRRDTPRPVVQHRRASITQPTGNRAPSAGGSEPDRDAGSTSLKLLVVSWMLVVVLVCATYPGYKQFTIAEAGADLSLMQSWSLWWSTFSWSWSGMAIGLGAVATLSMAFLAVVVGRTAWDEHQSRQVSDEHRCLLASWQGLSDPQELHESELLAWRQAQRRRRGRGPLLSMEQAQRWADAGIGIRTAVLAVQQGIELPRVRSLAQAVTAVMVASGSWGGDRPDSRPRALHDLIGEHAELAVPIPFLYPVLHRWLAFDLDTVRAALQDSLSQTPTPHASDGASALYVMEEQRVAVGGKVPR